MTESPRPDARAAAQRVKELTRELAPRVKDLAAELADGYRRSTKAVRLRAAVIGAWAVLSLASLWIACPGSDAPDNALGAKVRLETESIVGPQIAVENTSDDVWTNVVFTLDGTWRASRATVRPQETVVLAVAKFAGEDGGRAPKALRPATLRIDCDEGDATAPLAPEHAP